MGKPDGIAEGVLFFSSSASDFITGQILSVNGGHLMCTYLNVITTISEEVPTRMGGPQVPVPELT
jgi:hypothetical protein